MVCAWRPAPVRGEPIVPSRVDYVQKVRRGLRRPSFRRLRARAHAMLSETPAGLFRACIIRPIYTKPSRAQAMRRETPASRAPAMRCDTSPG